MKTEYPVETEVPRANNFLGMTLFYFERIDSIIFGILLLFKAKARLFSTRGQKLIVSTFLRVNKISWFLQAFLTANKIVKYVPINFLLHYKFRSF